MQAWKASEERAWLALSERVRMRGILAVTFTDEIASPSDVSRLMERLKAEAGPYFRKVVLAEECAAFALAPKVIRRSFRRRAVIRPSSRDSRNSGPALSVEGR